MNPQRVNLVLWCAAAMAGIAVPVSLYVGLVSPLDVAVNSDAQVGARPSAATSPTTLPTVGSVPSVETFGPALGRTFRNSLGYAAAVPASATEAPETPAKQQVTQLQLVGTIGDAEALIRGPDGTVALVELGDDVDGAALIAIAPSRVEFRQNGRVLVLRKSPPSDSTDVQLR